IKQSQSPCTTYYKSSSYEMIFLSPASYEAGLSFLSCFPFGIGVSSCSHLFVLFSISVLLICLRNVIRITMAKTMHQAITAAHKQVPNSLYYIPQALLV